MADQTYLPAALAGRCANGYERDQGRRIHAVPSSETLAQNGYCTTKAACGAKPGQRSAGWSLRKGEAVTCPRCLKLTTLSLRAAAELALAALDEEAAAYDEPIAHVVQARDALRNALAAHGVEGDGNG